MVGEVNAAFAKDPPPAIFSNVDGPFTITETEHIKYSSRQDFYNNKNNVPGTSHLST